MISNLIVLRRRLKLQGLTDRAEAVLPVNAAVPFKTHGLLAVLKMALERFNPSYDMTRG